MGKLENNKQQKRTSLLDTAFKLFTTQGVSKTSIAEISQKAGIAKGTFYLYFKDKYDIRNKLVSHEASKLFKNAVSALELHIKEQQINNHSFTITFTEEIIFIADHIINSSWSRPGPGSADDPSRPPGPHIRGSGGFFPCCGERLQKSCKPAAICVRIKFVPRPAPAARHPDR